MSRIFITGDVHFPIDSYKINEKNFPAADLTKDDYLIITGDAGFVWDGDLHDLEKIEWISSRPFTTIYVDGNHENHEALALYPVVDFHGAKAHQISKSLYHIQRGEILELNRLSFFCFGGAFSSDVAYRKENESWWQHELPTQTEVEYAIENLQKHHNKVNFIITHDVDESTRNALGYTQMPMDIYDDKYVDINRFLSYIKENVECDCWFAGHYHITQYVNGIQIMYNEILELFSDTLEWYQGRVHQIKQKEITPQVLKDEIKDQELFISLRYNQIGKMDDFKHIKDTIYPLNDFVDVLDSEQEFNAVIYLYKEYLMKC